MKLSLVQVLTRLRSRPAVTALGGAAFVVAMASVARAEPPRVEAPAIVAPVLGEDTLVLRDGRTLRGVIAELVTDDHATILVAGGEGVRVAWRDLLRVDSAEPLQAGRTKDAPTPSSETASVQGSGGETRETADVELDSLELVLVIRPGEDGAWLGACAAACGTGGVGGPLAPNGPWVTPLPPPGLEAQPTDPSRDAWNVEARRASRSARHVYRRMGATLPFFAGRF